MCQKVFKFFGDFGEKMSVSNWLHAKSAGYAKFSEISAKNECFQPACKEWWSVQIFGDFGEKANQCKMLFILTLSWNIHVYISGSFFRRFRRKYVTPTRTYFPYCCNRELKKVNVNANVNFNACNFWEISAKICNSNKNIFSILLYRELKKVNVNVNANYNACNFWEILAKKWYLDVHLALLQFSEKTLFFYSLFFGVFSR